MPSLCLSLTPWHPYGKNRTCPFWSAKLPSAEQEKLAEELIAHGCNINFIKWEAGSVLPETGRAMEHMASFDYGYKIAAVRDWLFKQSKE